MYDLRVTRGGRENSGDDICTVVGDWKVNKALQAQTILHASQLLCSDAKF
jgi:hypothetical protein